MSTETELLEMTAGKRGVASWKAFGAALAAVGVVFGGFQTAVTMPMRLDGHEKQIEALDRGMETIKAATQSDREILIRIEEQVKQLRSEMRGRRVDAGE